MSLVVLNGISQVLLVASVFMLVTGVMCRSGSVVVMVSLVSVIVTLSCFVATLVLA